MVESDSEENFDDNYSVVFEEFVQKAQIDINFTENDVIIEEFN